MQERHEVQVSFLDEGTAVWRPVVARLVKPGWFQLLGPVPYSERWEFPPGAVVRCERRALSGGVVLVAVEGGPARPGAPPDAGR
jgi:hypothetical protein